MDNDKFIGIQSIIINKPYNYEDAKKIAKKIMKKKVIEGKETKKNYKFVNIDKKKFHDKSFKTKKISPELSLVLGILKEEHQELLGGGIYDYFKKNFDKAQESLKSTLIRTDRYNNTTTNNLTKYGDLPIKRLSIFRTPIKKIGENLINLFTLGKFAKLKKEFNYDEFFHMALIADVGDKTLVIEKNEVINVNTSYHTTEKTEKLDVDMKGEHFTINEMMEEAREQQGDKKWFLYDPWENNCQYFIKYNLEAVGLYGEKEKEFIFQDIKEIVKQIHPVSKALTRGVMNTAAFVDKILGRGKKQVVKLRLNKK